MTRDNKAWGAAATRLTIRLDFSAGRRLGVGKVALLELIEKTGSISAAGRADKMSYRRAWLLVDELNQIFGKPVVSAHPGGAKGGGASLTDQGRRVVALYRDAEAKMRRLRRTKSASLSAASAPTARRVISNTRKPEPEAQKPSREKRPGGDGRRHMNFGEIYVCPCFISSGCSSRIRVITTTTKTNG